MVVVALFADEPPSAVDFVVARLGVNAVDEVASKASVNVGWMDVVSAKDVECTGIVLDCEGVLPLKGVGECVVSVVIVKRIADLV